MGLIASLAGLALGLASSGPATAMAGCAGSGESTSKITKAKARDAIACLFNKERSAKNVERDEDLYQAAQAHSAYMRTHDCFSHQCPGEAPLAERVRRTGYSSSPFAGEVLVGYPKPATPRQLVRELVESAGHRGVIRDGRYKDVGVGVSEDRGYVLVTGVFAHK